MKISRFFTAILCLALPARALTACRGTDDSPSTVADTTVLTETALPEAAYDPAHYVVIREADDLAAFNRAVNEDEYDFRDMTVVFLNDVDMADYLWHPLNGQCLAGVTFDGQGHTVRGLRLPDHQRTESTATGSGFIDVTTADITFRHLTLEDTRVRAFEHSVGNFIGAVRGGAARFEGCRSVGFRAEGRMEPLNGDPATGGHAVATRMGGFVGYVGTGGTARFTSCAVEKLTLQGFQNLAGFVGYDGAGTLSADCFTGCSIREAELTFAYPMAEGYDPDRPEKPVTVFYNAVDWQDTVEACLASGNLYQAVIYYDWANDGAAYTPDELRSRARMEDSHD